MLYRLTAKVTADAYIEKPYEFTQGAYTIKVSCDKENIVNEISIQKKSTNYKDYLPQLITSPDNIPTLIDRSGDNPDKNELIEVLQYLESLGSFWLNIRKIHWDFGSGTVDEWIPENAQEDEELKAVNNISVTFSPAREQVEFKANLVAELLRDYQYHKQLTIALSFYREGRNELDEFRYIQAFYNFYFFFEGLYGGGKYMNFKVADEFKNSTQLRTAVEQAILAFQTPEYARELKLLQDFIKLFEIQVQKYPPKQTLTFPFTVEGLLSLMVEVRGAVHHCSQNDPQASGHSFRQHEFEGFSKFVYAVCLNSYILLNAEICTVKPKFVTVSINHLEKGIVKFSIPKTPQDISFLLHKLAIDEAGKPKLNNIPYKKVTLNITPSILIDIGNALQTADRGVVIRYPELITCDQCNQSCHLDIYDILSQVTDELMYIKKVSCFINCTACDTNQDRRVAIAIIDEKGESMLCQHKQSDCLGFATTFKTKHGFACYQCFAKLAEES